MHSVVHSFKDHIWLSAPDSISRTGTEMNGFPRDEKGRTGKERRNYDKVRGEAAMWESAKGRVKPEPPIWRGDKCEQDGITGLTVWHRSAWTGNLPSVTHLLSHLDNWTGKTGRQLEWTLGCSIQILSSGLRILAGSLDIALSFKRLPRSRSGSHQTKDWMMWGCRGPASRQFRAATKSHKRVWNAVFGCNLKNYKMISVHFQGKSFNITIIQIYVPTTSAKEAEDDWFYEDLLKLTPEKRCPFHHRGLGFKSRKSSNIWSNRQVWPWSTKWSRAKANRVLPRERTGQSKHPLPTTQEMTLYMDITRWTIPKSDWLHTLQPKTEKLYTVSKNKTRSWLWIRSWIPYCKIQT